MLWLPRFTYLPRVSERSLAYPRYHCAITSDIDLRLSRYFGTSEGYWLRLQIAYDLTEARRAGRYDNIRPRAA